MQDIRITTYWAIWVVIGMITAISACTDIRSDERNKNLFDVNNSFVRFDYDNELRGQAKDSVELTNIAGQTFILPIALSAAEISEGVRLQWSWDSNLERGVDWEIVNTAGEIMGPEIILQAGQFEELMRFTLLREVAAPATIELALTQVTPEFIRLGFPGSGRGSRFLIKVTP